MWRNTLKPPLLWPPQCGNSQCAQLHWEIIPDFRKICVLILVMWVYEMETNKIFQGDLFFKPYKPVKPIISLPTYGHRIVMSNGIDTTWVKNFWDFRRYNPECAVAQLDEGSQTWGVTRCYLKKKKKKPQLIFVTFIVFWPFWKILQAHFPSWCLHHSVLQAQFRWGLRVSWPHWVILISLQSLSTFSVTRKGYW